MVADVAPYSVYNCWSCWIIVAVGVFASYAVYQNYGARKRRSLWASYGRDVVVIHQPGRGRFAPSMSPFVIKLESYLRLADIPYKCDFKEPWSPKGKTPWITLNGEGISDSQIVIEALAKHYGKNMSTHLTEEQRTVARAFTIMMDEHLIWGIRVWRYDIDKGAGFAECMENTPFLAKFFMPLYIWKMVRTLRYQGIGRHTFQEVLEIVEKDLLAVSTYLGKKPFFMGDQASEVDCAMFAHLANIYYNYRRSPFYDMLKGFGNLEAYILRLKDQLWPDWNQCLFPPK